MDDGFICDTCGFTSSEEVGTGNTYYCPMCGHKMRRASHSGVLGGGDANAQSGVLLYDLCFLVFVGGLSFGVVNYITYWTSDVLDTILFFVWLILFVLCFVGFHRKVKGSVSGRAVKR